jgi:hypothetical protein
VKIVIILFSSVHILFCFAEAGVAAVEVAAVEVEVAAVEVAAVVVAVADDEVEHSLKELSLVTVALPFGPFGDTYQHAFDTSNKMTTY